MIPSVKVKVDYPCVNDTGARLLFSQIDNLIGQGNTVYINTEKVPVEITGQFRRALYGLIIAKHGGSAVTRVIFLPKAA